MSLSNIILETERLYLRKMNQSDYVAGRRNYVCLQSYLQRFIRQCN